MTGRCVEVEISMGRRGTGNCQRPSRPLSTACSWPCRFIVHQQELACWGVLASAWVGPLVLGPLIVVESATSSHCGAVLQVQR